MAIESMKAETAKAETTRAKTLEAEIAYVQRSGVADLRTERAREKWLPGGCSY